jgi:glutathione synthase/RimK-type ligase-like ATP-grasp enzyme
LKPSLSRPLIITDEVPSSPQRVFELLEEAGHRPLLLQPSLLAAQDHSLSISVGPGDARVVDVDGERLELHADTRVWLRHPKTPRVTLTGSGSQDVARFIARQYKSALHTLYSLPCQWMNDASSAARLESNKPLQQMLAAGAGLRSIPTLCTDDPASFLHFANSAPADVAVKACEPWWTDLLDGDATVGTFTRRLTKLEARDLAESVRHAPVLVQPYVEKQHELRVTVVGSKLFTCRIDSQASPISAVDWRHYDFDKVQHEAIELEPELADRILDLTSNQCRLVFAAIDLIVGRDGHTYFVEVNPSGQYGWLEGMAGLKISEAIANWLVQQT